MLFHVPVSQTTFFFHGKRSQWTKWGKNQLFITFFEPLQINILSPFLKQMQIQLFFSAENECISSFQFQLPQCLPLKLSLTCEQIFKLAYSFGFSCADTFSTDHVYSFVTCFFSLTSELIWKIFFENKGWSAKKMNNFYMNR